MKHAGKETLGKLGPLLAQIRSVPGLKERSLGVFYRNSKPFLHFHEDPTGIFADIAMGGDWQRMPASSEGDWDKIVLCISHRDR